MAFIHSPKIVTDGLVLALDAANPRSYVSGSTNWYNLINNAPLSGSLINGTSYSSANLGTLVFDGVDDYVNYGYQPINFDPATQPFSMGGWMNLSSTIGGGDRAVLLDIGGTAAARLYIAIDKSNLRFVVDIRPPSGTTSVPVFGSINSISLGKWFHGMATFDGGTIKLYQNGELISTATGFTNYPVSTYNWNSGIQDDNDYYMNGYISVVSLYLKTLSADEVLQNFNALRGRYGV